MQETTSQRPRSSSTVHVPQEVYNVPSQGRLDLISEFRGVTGKESVSAAFWAFLYVCDLSKLRELVEHARSGISIPYLDTLERTFLSIPLQWMQKAPHDRADTPISTSSSSTNSSPRPPNRPSQPTQVARERDQSRCLFTRRELHEVAHIYPHALINPNQRLNMEQSIPEFWKLLRFFFDPSRLQSWHCEMFGDPLDPTRTTDGCHNRMCMNPEAHELWTRGAFALRPLEMSDDGKEILVEFFWQPRVSHNRFDVIPLSEVPSSSYGLTRSGENDFHVSEFPDEPRHAVTSGEIFTFRTPNPTTHPLPSFALLDMQWCLTRIVSMSGAADIFDEIVYDDDDDNE